MDYVSLVIGTFVAIMLSVSGFAMKHHKAYWLIAGYNTMSEEDKKNVDITNLAKLMANSLFVISGITFMASVFMFFNQTLAGLVLFSLIIPVSIYLIVRAQAYDGNTRRPDGTTKTRNKVLVGVIIGLLVATMVGIGLLLYFSNKPAEYVIRDDSLRITGQYGEEIKLSEILSIRMEEQIPEIQFKSNGSSLGNMKKGYFKLKEVGEAKLFVDTQKPPFIFLNVKSGLRIINTEDASETEELYNKLLEVWAGR